MSNSAAIPLLQWGREVVAVATARPLFQNMSGQGLSISAQDVVL
jgi:hypothetical protein